MGKRDEAEWSRWAINEYARASGNLPFERLNKNEKALLFSELFYGMILLADEHDMVAGLVLAKERAFNRRSEELGNPYWE